jgi:tetratricopeptide (TPR) repeat protein
MFSDMLIETNRVEEAVPLLRAIVRDNPRHAGAIWQLGYAYRYAGMLDESAQAGQAAYDVDPGFTPRSTVFNTWLYLGQYARFRDSVPQREGSAYTRFYQGFAEYHLGNFAAAARAFDEAYALDPEMLQARVGKALSHHLAARQGDGLRLMHETARQLETRGLNDAEGVYKVAQAFAVLGDQPAAIHWLESSITGGFFCYPYINTDPLLGNVRQLPRFRAALEQARQRHEAFRRTFF